MANVVINPSKEKIVATKANDNGKPKIKEAIGLTQHTKKRLRIMPITITMLSLLLVLKIYDIYAGTMLLRESGIIATAEASSPKKDEGKEEASAGHGDAKQGDDKHAKEKDKGNVGEKKISLGEIKALKKLGEQTKYSQVELDLLQSLAKRRDELDAREKELTIKSKVLDSTEQRINSKLEELKALDEKVKISLAQYDEKQAADVRSLVKIYESMKPSDAAAIFNELELPILLSVIDAMSERKVAPVLAAMDPKRAREVTEELAQIRKVKADASKTTSAAPAAPAAPKL